MGGIYMTPSVAERVAEDGFFYGYTSTTLFNIAVQGGGGLMIAVVIKYADNILKNFSTAISIIVSSVYSWLFMGFQLSYLFVVGVGLVNYAVWLYGKAPAVPKPEKMRDPYALTDEDRRAGTVEAEVEALLGPHE